MPVPHILLTLVYLHLHTFMCAHRDTNHGYRLCDRYIAVCLCLLLFSSVWHCAHPYLPLSTSFILSDSNCFYLLSPVFVCFDLLLAASVYFYRPKSASICLSLALHGSFCLCLLSSSFMLLFPFVCFSLALFCLLLLCLSSVCDAINPPPLPPPHCADGRCRTRKWPSTSSVRCNTELLLSC
jgi:hypothetical protein